VEKLEGAAIKFLATPSGGRQGFNWTRDGRTRGGEWDTYKFISFKEEGHFRDVLTSVPSPYKAVVETWKSKLIRKGQKRTKSREGERTILNKTRDRRGSSTGPAGGIRESRKTAGEQSQQKRDLF